MIRVRFGLLDQPLGILLIQLLLLLLIQPWASPITATAAAAVEITNASVAALCSELNCISQAEAFDNHEYDCWAKNATNLTDGNVAASLCRNSVPVRLAQVDLFRNDNGEFFWYYTCCPADVVAQAVAAQENVPLSDVDLFDQEEDGTNNSSFTSGDISFHRRVPPTCDPYWSSCLEHEGSDDEDEEEYICWGDAPYNLMLCENEDDDDDSNNNNNNNYHHPVPTGQRMFYRRWYYREYKCCSQDYGVPINSSIIVPESFLLALAVICLVFGTSVFVAILWFRQTRESPFNVYMAALVLANLLTVFENFYERCKMVAQSPLEEGGPNLLEYQMMPAFYRVTHFGIGFWLIHQLYQMLKHAKFMIRYDPPTMRQTLRRIAGVYVLGLVLAFYEVAEDALEIDFDFLYNMFNLLVVVLPPISYFLFVCIQIKRLEMLPISGRTRVYSVLILEIFGFFFVLWFVIVILTFLEESDPKWLIGSFYYKTFLYYINGVVVYVLMLSKPDIREAFQKVWACRWKDGLKTRKQRSQEKRRTPDPARRTPDPPRRTPEPPRQNEGNNRNDNNDNNNSESKREEGTPSTDSPSRLSVWKEEPDLEELSGEVTPANRSAASPHPAASRPKVGGRPSNHSFWDTGQWFQEDIWDSHIGNEVGTLRGNSQQLTATSSITLDAFSRAYAGSSVFDATQGRQPHLYADDDDDEEEEEDEFGVHVPGESYLSDFDSDLPKDSVAVQRGRDQEENVTGLSDFDSDLPKDSVLVHKDQEETFTGLSDFDSDLPKDSVGVYRRQDQAETVTESNMGDDSMFDTGLFAADSMVEHMKAKQKGSLKNLYADDDNS